MDWMALSELRWAIPKLLTPRRTVRSRGLRFTLQCDNPMTAYRWRHFNTKEPETLNWIDQWVRDGDTLFDVGANIGVYAIYAAVRHPRLRVMAFEPEYANLHLLRDNILQNALQDRIQVYAIGLSDRTGLSQLHIQDVTPGAALHTESMRPIQETLMQRPVVWREGIGVWTMDAFCRESGLYPNAIKLDVDGTEHQILGGAAQVLAIPQLRSIIMEPPPIDDARRACEQLLRQAGFCRPMEQSANQANNEVWVRP